MDDYRNKVFTVSGFAKLLNCSRPTVMKMIETGGILAFKLSDEFGGHYRIKGSEIDRLISAELGVKNEINPSISIRKGFSRLHRIWLGMKFRCENPKCHAFKHYGGRGIKVCERWQNFDYFIDDMGLGPPPWSIDRIDNDKGYEITNCVWSTPIGQGRNKRNVKLYEVDGKKMSLFEYAKLKNLNYRTLMGRVYNGFCDEDILYEGLFIKGNQ